MTLPFLISSNFSSGNCAATFALMETSTGPIPPILEPMFVNFSMEPFVTKDFPARRPLIQNE